MDRPTPDEMRHARRTSDTTMCGVALPPDSHLLQLSGSRDVFEEYLLPAEDAGFLSPDLCTQCLDELRRELGHLVPADYEQFARVERTLRYGGFLNACVKGMLSPTGRTQGLWQISTLDIERGGLSAWGGNADTPTRRMRAEIIHPPNLLDAGTRNLFLLSRLYEEPAVRQGDPARVSKSRK